MNNWWVPCSYSRCLKLPSSISRYKECITCHPLEHTVIHRHQLLWQLCEVFLPVLWYMWVGLHKHATWQVMCVSKTKCLGTYVVWQFWLFFKSRNHAIEVLCMNLILLCTFNVITLLQQCWHTNFHYHGYLCMKVLFVLAV